MQTLFAALLALLAPHAAQAEKRPDFTAQSGAAQRFAQAAQLCSEVVLRDSTNPLHALTRLSRANWGKSTLREVYALPDPELQLIVLLNTAKRKVDIGDCIVEPRSGEPGPERKARMEAFVAWTKAEAATGALIHDPCEGVCASYQHQKGGWLEDFFFCAGPREPVHVSGGYFDGKDPFSLSLSRFAVLGAWRKNCP